MLYDSIIPCFGGRFCVVMLPEAHRYHVHPLGTFHFFDWQKPDKVGISIGTCPQIVSSETARIGVEIDGIRRILPFDRGPSFADLQQTVTPLTTQITADDPMLPVRVQFEFRTAFYPKSFEYSAVPAYSLAVSLYNDTDQALSGSVYFGLPVTDYATDEITDSTGAVGGFGWQQPVIFPDGIDHAGIENLTFDQVLVCEEDHIVSREGNNVYLTVPFNLPPSGTATVRFVHAGYIAEPTLNVQGDLRKFGYTTLWHDAADAALWWLQHYGIIQRRSDLFESTIMDAQVSPEFKLLLASSFKGLAANTWWAEKDWISVMEVGAYHSTLDVDAQLMLFFFQYWPELVLPMLNQWAHFHEPGCGYMNHDIGQHLQADGNHYRGPGSAMKVEENCNYLLLLHQYWRVTGDPASFSDKHELVRELVDFCIAQDTTGSGLPNENTENTNDWGSALVTTATEQSYHGVRLVAAYTATAQMAAHLGDEALAQLCTAEAAKVAASMEAAWLGDHYPISLADESTYGEYSMWTAHGLLYPQRCGLELPLDLDKLRVDVIVSTARTLREHGTVHSTSDTRGWLTQNFWRDSVAAYLGLDFTDHLRRYLGHGEYVSYEDTAILEVANELMVVPGAVAEHKYAGQRHDFPMIDGHPRPATGFGLLYALAGLAYDAVDKRFAVAPVVFPLKIALTHLADWEAEQVPWLVARRSTPNRDTYDDLPTVIAETVTVSVKPEEILSANGLAITLHTTV